MLNGPYVHNKLLYVLFFPHSLPCILFLLTGWIAVKAHTLKPDYSFTHTLMHMHRQCTLIIHIPTQTVYPFFSLSLTHTHVHMSTHIKQTEQNSEKWLINVKSGESHSLTKFIQ